MPEIPSDILKLIIKLADNTETITKIKKENKELRDKNAELTMIICEHCSQIFHQLSIGTNTQP